MKPGTIDIPLASMICVRFPTSDRISALVPIATKRPALTANACATGCARSIVNTFAFTTTSSGSIAALAANP